MDCTPEIVDLVAASGGRFAPHFHLPLQHASDRMLRADAPAVHARRTTARSSTRSSSACRTPSIGTDMIVGFPGETRRRLRGERSTTCRRRRCRTCTSSRTRIARAPRRRRWRGKVARRGRPRARRRGCARSARRWRAGSASAQIGTVRPGLTLEDGTLVVTDNYLKVRIPPGLARNRAGGRCGSSGTAGRRSRAES